MIQDFFLSVAYATSTTIIENPLQAQDIFQLIDNLANFIFAISIPVVTIMFIIGGFKILTSEGQEKKVTEGKNLLLYTAVGFGIILLSKGFTLIIMNLFSVK